MRLVALVVVVLAVPRLAAAHHCREESSIVGREQCLRFGARWAGLGTTWWEFGVESLHFDPKPFDASPTYQIVSTDERPITAAGGRFRWLAGIGRTWFFGPDIALAQVTHGPRLVADVQAHGMTTTMDTTTEGFVAQSEFLVGVHRTYGLVTLATALGAGGRFALLEAKYVPNATAAQMWFVVEPHAKADAWITPNVTLGFDASIDVLHGGDYAAAIVLGLHLLPYDRTR